MTAIESLPRARGGADGPGGRIAGQAVRFAAVGALATATHAGVAMAAGWAFDLSPLQANLAGYLAAVGVSYLGHAGLTFRSQGPHRRQAPRFAAVSLAGFLLSSAITALVCDVLDGSLGLAMAVVALVVPGVTFAASRSWAFRPGPPIPPEPFR